MTKRCHRVAQITDLHLRADAREPVHGLDTDASARRVIAAVERWRPSLVVASGDLAECGEAGAYERLFDHLAALEVPVLPMAGNHDDAAVLAAIAARRGRPLRAAVRAGRWTLHCLDSSLADRPDGALGAERLAALEGRLGNGPALVFVHHHPAPVDSPWIDAMGLADGAALLEMLSRRRRPCVVAAGHVHQALGGWHGPVRWLTTPSTCNQVRPFTSRYTPDPAPPGFRWFRLWDDARWETGVIRVDA